jgi:hypothetical protein
MCVLFSLFGEKALIGENNLFPSECEEKRTSDEIYFHSHAAPNDLPNASGERS